MENITREEAVKELLKNGWVSMDSDYYTDSDSRFISPNTKIDYSFENACRIAEIYNRIK